MKTSSWSDFRFTYILNPRLQIEKMEEEEEAVGLKASLGLIQGCTIIVGSIIGSGIFIAPGGVLKQTGSVNMSLTIWILSGNNLTYSR